MGDEVTCPICGLPIDFKEWTCGNQSVCAGANMANCYRLGYEREKARADEAVAQAGRYFDCMETADAQRNNASDALAAARRAETAAKEAHTYCLYMFTQEWLAAPEHRNIFAARIFAILNAALAAPAAGEEGKR